MGIKEMNDRDSGLEKKKLVFGKLIYLSLLNKFH